MQQANTWKTTLRYPYLKHNKKKKERNFHVRFHEIFRSIFDKTRGKETLISTFLIESKDEPKELTAPYYKTQ